MQKRRKNIPGRGTGSPEDLDLLSGQQGGQYGWNVGREEQRGGSRRERLQMTRGTAGWKIDSAGRSLSILG